MSGLVLHMGMLSLLKGQIYGSIPLSSCILFCIVKSVQIALSCLLVLESEVSDREMVVSGLLLPSCLVAGRSSSIGWSSLSLGVHAHVGCYV